MSIRSNADDAAVGQDDLRKALIKQRQLSVADEQAIAVAMRKVGMNFVDAALHLGLITTTDIEDAIAWSKRRENTARPGLIEAAINKMTPQRKPLITESSPATPNGKLLFANNADVARSEGLRALRTELLLLEGSTSRGPSRAMVLLSPRAQEGRSQLAAELAIAFSQLGRRTLLVDADLRNPKQHELFGVKNDYGLVQAITSLDPPRVHPVTGMQYLAVLTSGPIPSNPLELLSDDRLSRLIINLRSTYEFIVIDTPPVAQYADGLAVATVAGEVLIVSRAQHSEQKEMRTLLRRMASTRAQVLGAILNHF